MIIRRIRLVLPARLKATASPAARILAETLATEMALRGVTEKQSLTLPAAGQTSAGIAHRIGPALGGGRHGR
jgi:hypothetical protein